MKGKGAYLKDLTTKTVKELVHLRNKLRGDLYKLEMKHSIKGLKETHKIGQTRKEIARVSTVLSSKLHSNDNNMK